MKHWWEVDHLAEHGSGFPLILGDTELGVLTIAPLIGVSLVLRFSTGGQLVADVGLRDLHMNAHVGPLLGPGADRVLRESDVRRLLEEVVLVGENRGLLAECRNHLLSVGVRGLLHVHLIVTGNRRGEDLTVLLSFIVARRTGSNHRCGTQQHREKNGEELFLHTTSQ